jgi:uncharacterized protein (DUF1778 family)
MAHTQTNKTARLEARATRQQKQMIERAANLRGTSVTDFVILAAQKEAVETIRDFETLNLSRESSRAFVDALLNPPAPNAALRAAAHRHLSVRA